MVDELDIDVDLDADLPISEEMDFHYLLTLMGPLYKIPQYGWLPELFSIVGYKRLILLCKYAGGETITIPTMKELSSSVEALQHYYDVYIKKTKEIEDVPKKYRDLIDRIKVIFDAG